MKVLKRFILSSSFILITSCGGSSEKESEIANDDFEKELSRLVLLLSIDNNKVKAGF